MNPVRRWLALLGCVLLVVQLGPTAHAAPPGTCVHVDVSVTARSTV